MSDETNLIPAEVILIEAGWKRTYSGRFKHDRYAAHADGRVQLFKLRDAVAAEQRHEQELDITLRKVLRDALVRPLETEDDVRARGNLLAAMGFGEVMGLTMAQREFDSQHEAKPADLSNNTGD